MADKKEEVPKHIQEYEKNNKKAKALIDGMQRHHRGAWDSAADAHLVKDGSLDMELLEKDEVQEKFANSMADYYLDKARKLFGVKAEKDDKGKEKKPEKTIEALLLNAYAGTTRERLLQAVRENGRGFSFEGYYGKVVPKMTEGIYESLLHAASGHFKKDHVKDIVDYVAGKSRQSLKYLDTSRMTTEDAKGLLIELERDHAIHEDAHKRRIYYKKPESK